MGDIRLLGLGLGAANSLTSSVLIREFFGKTRRNSEELAKKKGRREEAVKDLIARCRSSLELEEVEGRFSTKMSLLRR